MRTATPPRPASPDRRYELSSSSPFLANLLVHYRPGCEPVFPGASGMALRLFAFYVSWMRRHFTQVGVRAASAIRFASPAR
jgi:hypothetical protein